MRQLRYGRMTLLVLGLCLPLFLMQSRATHGTPTQPGLALSAVSKRHGSDAYFVAAAPVLTSLSPATAVPGGPGFVLTVNGSGFVATSKVRWNNGERFTTFVSATQLTANIFASDIAEAGAASVTVVTPGTGGGTSNALTFLITTIPCPSVSGLAPASGLVGVSVTITGTNFTGTTAVKFANNVTAQFAVVSDTQLTATVPVGAVTGSLSISKTGCPDVQTTPFTVIACPAISLSPAVPPGLPGGIVGTAYNQTVAALPAPSSGGYTFSISQGALPAGLILNANTGAITGTPTAAGTANFTITALSAGPCSGSQAYSITIVDPNPVPVLTSLDPNTRIVGSQGFTLALNGTGFIATSQVKWNDSDRQTAFVSSTRLTINVPASDLAAVGVIRLTVFNPAPGGGTSNGLNLTISNLAYEGDVAPRPNGTSDGTVTLADYVQVGRFASGLDAADAGSEFQRADCAPRESLGDGQITLADYVQAGRYAIKLDPVVQAGGPSGVPTSAPAPIRARSGTRTAQAPRSVSALDRDLTFGQRNELPIEIVATGQENALAFSLRFDAQRWRLLTVKPGRDVARGKIQANGRLQEQGRIGVTLILPPGETLAVGHREIVTLVFAPLHTVSVSTVPLSFGDEPVTREIIDVQANALSAAFMTETAQASTAKSVSLAPVVQCNPATFTGHSLQTVLPLSRQKHWRVRNRKQAAWKKAALIAAREK